jgi:predicted ATPase/serine/threonine protein kinase
VPPADAHEDEEQSLDAAVPQQIGRFAVLGKLGHGGMGVVFLGHDVELERKVAIKLLRSNATRTIGKHRMVREAQGLARLSHPNVIQVHEIGEHGDSMFVAMEYVEGSTLRDWLDAERRPWRQAIDMVRQAGRGLEAAHAAGLVHRDFKPSNVMVGKDGRARVVDFGLARASGSASQDLPLRPSAPELLRINDTLCDSGVFEGDPMALTRSGAVLGTPAYMAPEQMQGRSSDPLSDQFSFCVSAYEALFGHRPFAGKTFAELASNVARGAIEPIPAESLVPVRVQQAVLRGLAAEPERRWPSMSALLDELDNAVTMVDLQSYLEQMRHAASSEQVEPEPPRADRFRVPERLYGREAQLEILVDAFERTRTEPGPAQLLLVSGVAGIGKSALLERLRPIVESKAAMMCGGQFDPQRATPLTGIAQALDELVAQLERLEPGSARRLRQELTEVVGRNARLLIELVPATARLLDVPEAIADRHNVVERFAIAQASPERLNRLHLVVTRFLSAVATPTHPLVLFLENLQWVDEPSLALLHHLLSSSTPQALLIIGTYRSNELGPQHPLREALERLASGGLSITHVELEALSLADTEALLVDTLGADRQAVRDFAVLALGKTEGNPFYLRQLVRTIHDEGLFEFDAVADAWRWDLERIAESSAFDDIGVVLRRGLESLPAPSLQLIQIAACAGYRVELRTLAAVADRAPLDVFSDLWPTFQQGLLLVEAGLLDDVELVESGTLAAALGGVVIRFGHARIHQAALASLGAPNRARMHLNIGRMLRVRLDEDQQRARVFEAVDQLNAGRSLLDGDERTGLIELNLQCGRRAIESGAFASAIEYLEVASELLAPNAPTHEHALWFAVTLERGRALTLESRYREAFVCYRALLDEIEDEQERLLVHVAEVEHALLVADYESGYAACRRGFALLGIDLPERDEDVHAMFVAELDALVSSLRSRTPTSLAELPDIEDYELFPVPELLHGLGTLSYIAGHRNVNGWIVAKTANLAAHLGNSKVSTVAYARITLHLAERGDYELAEQFGQLVFSLCRHFDDPSTTGRAMIAYLGHAAYYNHSVLELLPHFENAFGKCLEGGDLLYAGHHLLFPQYCRLIGGVPLSEIMAAIAADLPFLRRSVPSMLVAFYVPHVVVEACTLMDVPLAEFELEFDHEKHIASLGRLSYAMGWYWSAQTKLGYLLGQRVDLDELVRRITTVEIGVPGHLQIRETRYYAILSLLDPATPPQPDEAERAHERIEAWRADLARCAARCPSNFRHKHLLVEAELARVNGAPLEQTISLYEQAIEDAREHGVLDQEALACWRFAEFWHKRGSKRTALVYFESARELYQTWGARRLVRVLDERCELAVHGNKTPS